MRLPGAFFLYAGIAFLGFCWLWATLPETRGVSLEEMAVLFGGSATDIEQKKNHKDSAGDAGSTYSTFAENIVHERDVSSIELERRKDP